MSNILQHNIDILINNISNKFEISKQKLSKLKPTDILSLTIKNKNLPIHLDKKNNKYVLLFCSDDINNVYYALQIEK